MCVQSLCVSRCGICLHFVSGAPAGLRDWTAADAAPVRAQQCPFCLLCFHFEPGHMLSARLSSSVFFLCPVSYFVSVYYVNSVRVCRRVFINSAPSFQRVRSQVYLFRLCGCDCMCDYFLALYHRSARERACVRRAVPPEYYEC